MMYILITLIVLMVYLLGSVCSYVMCFASIKCHYRMLEIKYNQYQKPILINDSDRFMCFIMAIASWIGFYCCLVDYIDSRKRIKKFQK